MFMGTVYNSIDEKNRMIVPAKLRAGLGNRCILTKGLDKCLYIYTEDDWEGQMEKIAKLPESDPKVRAFIRHFCANAAECEFDKQGRIVIPAELREYAGIEKELVTMGAMSKIEIWSKNVWEAPENDNRMDAEDFANALAEYNF
ncbi:MAG: division/cell wall cluster transcriptional repressor MraZ [Anaerovoracaceae bacterium]|nr:division/cell wall cluster transcriptional repressor MraZ [Bacillota bacterium]MEE0517763.1 division/cell wall cluster transcriptional repressor MraZ [Anaerovoracaceae bacterium]